METCEDETMECRDCGNTIGEDDDYFAISNARDLPYGMRSHGPGMFCRDCLRQCDSCNRLTDTEEMLYDSSCRDHVCGECYCERWTSCDNCGDEVSTEYSRYDDNSGYTYCPECYSEQAGGCSLPVEQCHQCGTNNVHFHLLSERYVCDCKAEMEPAAYIVRVNTLQNA